MKDYIPALTPSSFSPEAEIPQGQRIDRVVLIKFYTSTNLREVLDISSSTFAFIDRNLIEKPTIETSPSIEEIK